jgi:hypothetical protein
MFKVRIGVSLCPTLACTIPATTVMIRPSRPILLLLLHRDTSTVCLTSLYNQDPPENEEFV